MKIAIVKYNAGNIQSVLYALERIGKQALVTDDHAEIKAADKVIFPGVGEASTAMAYLSARGLDTLIRDLRQPVLGICLGMQLMCRHSEENDTACMGIFEEEVKKFDPKRNPSASDSLTKNVMTSDPLASDPSAGRKDLAAGEILKVPQIGWNTIYDLQTPLFAGLASDSYCYFVHGYYAAKGKHTIATTDYILPYSSALHKGNFYGVQFHPEKSAQVGERILRNFVEDIG